MKDSLQKFLAARMKATGHPSQKVFAASIPLNENTVSRLFNGSSDGKAHDSNTRDQVAKALLFSDWPTLVKAFRAGDVTKGLPGVEYIEQKGVTDRQLVVGLVNMTIGDRFADGLYAEMVKWLSPEQAAKLAKKLIDYVVLTMPRTERRA